MDEQREMACAYWMYRTKGLGAEGIRTLLKTAGCASAVPELPAADLRACVGPRIADEMLDSLHQDPIPGAYHQLVESGLRFVPEFSPAFPNQLREIRNPPFALFVKGALPDPARPAIAVIGARMCSDYGRQMAREFALELASSGVQIISGMAHGIDSIAQLAALQAGGTSYAVLGCGVDICYPPESRDLYDALPQHGGILSEYLPGTEPRASLFPPRNRIISALCDAVLVIEARSKSGTLITVDMALEQGKEVYALPGRVTDRLSDGCNRLLSLGAGVAISPEKLLQDLALQGICCQVGQPASGEVGRGKASAYQMDSFSPEEQLILHQLQNSSATTALIAERLHRAGSPLTMARISSTLLELTFRGIITETSGLYSLLVSLKES